MREERETLAWTGFYIKKPVYPFSQRVSRALRPGRVNMKAILALLFLAAISVFVQAEWASEFHPQAMLEYVKGEDHEMKRQLYHLVKMDNGFETSFKREFQPSVRPSIQPGLLRVSIESYPTQWSNVGHE